MNKQKLIDKLNRLDLPGVGCVVLHTDGRKTYNFYEDFENDKGVDRAAKQFTELINAGKVSRVDYIYKDHTTIHFWDWETKPGSFCAADEMRKFNKCHGFEYYYDWMQRFITVMNGLEYKYDYTPAVDGISAITATLANK